MSRAHRRRTLAVVGAVEFAVAWYYGLWLVVLALSSAAAVLARQRFVARRGLPARLAAWAAHAPCGPSTPVALEHAMAVDLAAVSEGHLDSLERAQAVLAHTVEDPWRRALGEERLTRAQRLVGEGALVGVHPRVESPVAALRRAGAAVALIVLVAAGTLSQSQWWLVPMAVVHALLAWEFFTHYERRRALPELLASRSVREPIRGLFLMREDDIARSLVTLANHDRVVIQRARRLLERRDQHRHARRRLAEAERLVVHRGASAPGATLVAWLMAIAVPATSTATSPGWGSW
ncbi:MAG TPA: hypothetical protein VG078_11115 [Acidimicrobiales bacterium]|nr:hypothetical protein [Acidimicrobiales bacterium]